LLLGAAAILAFFPHATLEQAQAVGESVAGPFAAQTVTAPVMQSAEPASAAAPAQTMVAAPIAAPEAPAVESPAVPASVASVAEAAPESGSELLIFRARTDSWIQVRDASGATTLQRVITAGERVAAPGKPPFAVVVGKADATEVLVRGKVFDLVSVSRDNVARFEVKP